MPKRNKEHYVKNADFFEAIVDYKTKLRKSRENQTKTPMISNYIGDCFMRIARRLTFKPNFVNYSYKEEMISDAIEDCVRRIDNFNQEKSSNPFAYFTQISKNAFIRRIKRENQQTEIKNKMIDRSGYEQVMTVDDSILMDSYNDFNAMKDNISYRNH